MQVVGQLAFEPLHKNPLHPDPSAPAAWIVHFPSWLAPSAAEHASQPPEQAVSQQNPSTQKPLTHSAPDAQAWPFKSLHWPVASQAFGAAQVSGSEAPVTVWQLPVAFAHDWQVPVQPVEQQVLSLQIALAHSTCAAQL